MHATRRLTNFTCTNAMLSSHAFRQCFFRPHSYYMHVSFLVQVVHCLTCKLKVFLACVSCTTCTRHTVLKPCKSTIVSIMFQCSVIIIIIWFSLTFFIHALSILLEWFKKSTQKIIFFSNFVNNCMHTSPRRNNIWCVHM